VSQNPDGSKCEQDGGQSLQWHHSSAIESKKCALNGEKKEQLDNFTCFGELWNGSGNEYPQPLQLICVLET
jgi:hypothetical protein